jgi:Ca-activated chloride channel family protein
MPFLAPLGLLGLLAIPVIAALYVLRLRRDERVVSSTYLWQQLVRDVEANAPWQRLRRSLLFLLQLLLAAALAFIVARPFAERPAGLSRDLVLIVDASASMRATDEFPDRLAAAKRVAIEALGELPADGRVSIVAAGAAARVIANEVTDRGRATRLIEEIEAATSAADMEEALKLAGALAARARGAEILVVTDDAGSIAPQVRLDVPVRVRTVGRDRHNQAIAALAVRAGASGVERSVFVSVANLDSVEVVRRLQILADGSPVSARDVTLRPLSRADVVIDELPEETRVVEARLVEPEGALASAAAGPTDQLAIDDAAWAIVPSARPRYVLLVGEGNVYLQNAFALLPNVELYGATPAEWPTTEGKDRFDLIVFDRWLPDELPAKPILAIAPPTSSALGTVGGTVRNPVVGLPAPDEPLLRNVDLTRLHIASARRIEPPPWARVVLPGPTGAPLLFAGRRDGLASAVLSFELQQSDLPLQVAWPVLVSNLAGELLGLDPADREPLAPGTPVEVVVPPGTSELRVTRPDGEVVVVPVAPTAGSATFVATDALGVYRTEIVAAPAGSSPSASPGTAASPSPTDGSPASPSPSGSGSPATTPPPASYQPTLFAVDFFDLEESNITPGDGSRLVAAGREKDGTQSAGLARDEFWPLLALLVLVLLVAEWLIYERDGARRLAGRVRELLRARPRRRGAG